jgi:hypothetical protein
MQIELIKGPMPDPTFAAIGATRKVTGLTWPESLGDFTLMSPPNHLGAWRWYQRNLTLKGARVNERIKLDHRLQPIWDSLVITHA